MKERKYKESYTLHTQIDPITGKEKRVPVYQGDYYEYPDSYQKKKTFYPLWLVLSGLCFGCWGAYLFAGTPSSSCMYVLPIAAMCIFPFFYLVLGLVGTAKAPLRMDVVQKEKGPGRVCHSFWGCLWLSGAAIIGDVIFIFVGHCFGKEWLGLFLLLLCFGFALLGMLQSRKVCRSLQIGKGGNKQP